MRGLGRKRQVDQGQTLEIIIRRSPVRVRVPLPIFQWGLCPDARRRVTAKRLHGCPYDTEGRAAGMAWSSRFELTLATDGRPPREVHAAFSKAAYNHQILHSSEGGPAPGQNGAESFRGI